MTSNQNSGASLGEVIGNLLSKKSKPPKVSHEKSQKIAYYSGLNNSNTEEVHSKIIIYGAELISFARQDKLIGTSLLNDNKVLAYHKAGATLLDALDCGAQLLIVENKNDFDMFNDHYANITKIIGRDIELSMIMASDFDAFAQENQTEEVA